MHAVTGRQRVVIVGGGYAGQMAAARAARGGGLDVTLVDARAEFTQRIRLHELLAGRRVPAFAYAPALRHAGVAFRQGGVERLALERGRVAGRDAAGAGFELPYDALILALGSRTPARAPGVEEHAVRLDEPESVRRASTALPRLSASGGRVLVVGGGLTGIEAAAELAERWPGLRVVLATRQPVGASISAEADAHFRRRFAELGVELIEGAGVEGLELGQAHLTGGDRLPFDLCVWSGGFVAGAPGPLSGGAGPAARSVRAVPGRGAGRRGRRLRAAAGGGCGVPLGWRGEGVRCPEAAPRAPSGGAPALRHHPRRGGGGRVRGERGVGQRGPPVVVWIGGRLDSIYAFDAAPGPDGDTILGIVAVRNPDKLGYAERQLRARGAASVPEDWRTGGSTDGRRGPLQALWRPRR